MTDSPKLAIFDTFKTRGIELTGEAKRQRAIITILAIKQNPTDRTRTAISQNIAKKQGIIWKNIYSGIFRDLDEILIPLGLVEEEGRLPLLRGPKALQEKGIPFYHLTQRGLVVALSLTEIENKTRVLDLFFSQTSEKERKFEKTIKRLYEITPIFVFSIFEKYTKAYCEDHIKDLLPFDLMKLGELHDESLSVLKEILEGFVKLNAKERDECISLLREIV